MRCQAIAEEGFAAPVLDPIDILRWDSEIARRNFLTQATDGRETDDLPNARLFQRIDIGAVIDLVRQELMMRAVARQEDDFFIGIAGFTQRSRRLAKGRSNVQLFNHFQA